MFIQCEREFYQRLMKLIIHIQPLGYYRLLGHGRGLPRPFQALFRFIEPHLFLALDSLVFFAP